MINPLLLGSLVGTGLGLAGGIAGQFTPNAFRERAELKKDTQAMRAGKLGLSDATKRQQAGQAVQQAQAQQQAQAAELQRMASAGGLSGGAAQQALQAQSSLSPQIAAQAMALANQQSQNLAEQRKQSILARMGNQTQRLSQALGSTAKAVTPYAVPSAVSMVGGKEWDETVKQLLNAQITPKS